MAINPRTKGHKYELDIRDWFRELGWERAVSSRSESKNKDDQGIDLCYTDPFNVQAKAVEKLGSIHDVLAKMPNDSNYNVVFHKKNRKGTIVAMTIEDFKELLESLIKNGIVKAMMILLLFGCKTVKHSQEVTKPKLINIGNDTYMYIKNRP